MRQSGRENNVLSFSRRKSQVAGPVWGPGRVGLFSYSELLNKVEFQGHNRQRLLRFDVCSFYVLVMIN